MLSTRSIVFAVLAAVTVVGLPTTSTAQQVEARPDSTVSDSTASLLHRLGLRGDAGVILERIRARYDSLNALGSRGATSPWDIAVLVPPPSELLDRMPIGKPDISCDCVFDPTEETAPIQPRNRPRR